jgi:hypothetical protein
MRLKLLTIVVLLVVTAAAQQSKRIDDDFDWWSLMRTDEPVSNKSDRIRTPAGNLQIAGMSLLDPSMSAKLQRKMGHTVEIARGDAATGRHPYCYSSTQGPKTYLIFEFGEVDSAFYLFSDGLSWNGSEYCKSSSLVTNGLSTPSGLKLGISRADFEKLLGKPTLVKGDRIIYVRSISVKSTPEELKRAKIYAPDMNEQEFQQNYAHWDFSTHIEASFKEGKLYHLAVSQGETL